jgi:fructosamine-3-kinase
MARTFSKRYLPGQPGSAPLEAAGLAWLAAAPGGARTPALFQVTDTALTMERIPPTAPNPEAAEALGQALAHTHAAGAGHFGQGPPGWAGQGSIGLAPLTLLAQPVYDSWGAFYQRERLAPYVALAARRAALPEDGRKVFAKLAERLEAGVFDSPQPSLCGQVARIHGDLWAGNVLWDPLPIPEEMASWTGAAVVDPAAHGGHAETDLAMLSLFGLPELAVVLAAYAQTSPLADGWRERVGLHQLHPLLVHACLFGGAYGDRAVAKAKAYL